jgi:hypothetical protein
MNKKIPYFSFGDRPVIFLGLTGLSKSKMRNFVGYLALGVFVVVFLIYGILTWGRSNAKVQYSPADIVYGDQVHAVHDMGSSLSPQQTIQISANSKGKPKILLSENFYDFGLTDSGLVLTRTFVVANSGQSPLVIAHAYTTCGCTIADFTAKEIPPEKVALMILKFDSGFHDMRGTTVRRGVIIETNDPDHPTQEIWIQATIR